MQHLVLRIKIVVLCSKNRIGNNTHEPCEGSLYQIRLLVHKDQYCLLQLLVVASRVIHIVSYLVLSTSDAEVLI